MARTVTVSVPADRTDALIDDLKGIEGLVSLHRQDGVSLQPPGDVVTAEVVDAATSTLLGILTRYGAGRDDGVSVSSSEPDGMVSSSSARALAADLASTSFEDIEFRLDREASMGLNEMIVMAIAGGIAAAGLATNAVHLVIGAMVIAPGFEPFLKISLTMGAGGDAWKRGMVESVKGYGSLVLGALAVGLALRLTGVELSSEPTGYLSSGALLSYWRSISVTATIVAVIAAVAGPLLINANRPVLTAGVMIALALIPGAALVGMGVASGSADMAFDGMIRWGHDAVIVVGVGALVFLIMRLTRGRGLHDPGPGPEPARR